jgi:hypothetical protein
MRILLVLPMIALTGCLLIWFGVPNAAMILSRDTPTDTELHDEGNSKPSDEVIEHGREIEPCSLLESAERIRREGLRLILTPRGVEMRSKTDHHSEEAEKAVRDIRRATRRNAMLVLDIPTYSIGASAAAGRWGFISPVGKT